MPATAVVRARIDETVKNEATEVLAEFGLTVSDIVRIVLTKVAKEKAVPLELKSPNAETRAAMEAARAMGRARYATPDQLFDALEKRGKR